ncbi:MAG: hypothetical protein LBL58_01290 [Tannerellaceae bacterium]|jgi:hypothetical protein|nr:hypothetical protein [Tannerellaceae bacterium]
MKTPVLKGKDGYSSLTGRWKQILRVKGARFTLLSALGEGFRGLVEGESSMHKPPERGDKNRVLQVSQKNIMKEYCNH